MNIIEMYDYRTACRHRAYGYGTSTLVRMIWGDRDGHWLAIARRQTLLYGYKCMDDSAGTSLSIHEVENEPLDCVDFSFPDYRSRQH